MKTILFIATLLLSTITVAQFPITENFNPGTTWTFTSGAGIQNYGPPENYATTNVGTTPYPNSANVTITSPAMSLTNCLGTMIVSFPISGIIENGWDFLRFQYRIGAGAWITVQSFTGNQNTTYSTTSIPNTATQFRFLLQTDNTVNTYTTGPWWNPTTNVYYYDIASFSITCNIVLPVELVFFKGYDEGPFNKCYWGVESETDSDYYIVERSENGVDWVTIEQVSSTGISNYWIADYDHKAVINYYRLSQFDLNGIRTTYDNWLVSIDNRLKEKEIINSYNLIGQTVKPDAMGVVIIQYKDGSIKRILNQ